MSTLSLSAGPDALAPRAVLLPGADARRLAGLWFLALVPVVAGSMRLVTLADGSLPEGSYDARHGALVAVHVLAAMVFAFVGSLQFAAALRRSLPRLHRRLGWVLAPAGVLSAASGFWLRLFHEEPGTQGFLIGLVQMPFAVLWIAFLWLGVVTIRRGDRRAHGAWMLRAYALGLSVSPQLLFFLPFFAFGAWPTGVPGALYAGVGGLVNLLVAERLIRRGEDARRPAPADVRG